jgi:hypothetical protein
MGVEHILAENGVVVKDLVVGHSQFEDVQKRLLIADEKFLNYFGGPTMEPTKLADVPPL